MDEEELERLAAEELLREAKQGAARASVHGALGWKKDNAPRPNKRFLTTTLANTMQYNYRRSRSRSFSPHNKHKDRLRDRYSSHEPSLRDRKSHKSKDEDHKERQEQRRDRKSRKDRNDIEQYSKKHGHNVGENSRKTSKSRKGRSHH